MKWITTFKLSMQKEKHLEIIEVNHSKTQELGLLRRKKGEGNKARTQKQTLSIQAGKEVAAFRNNNMFYNVNSVYKFNK